MALTNDENATLLRQKRLADIGDDISDLFRSLNSVYGAKDRDTETGSHAIVHEADRFELWAINLGLHHSGHSSLDYRLRDVDFLQETFRALLNDLERSLTQISQTNSGGNLFFENAAHPPSEQDSSGSVLETHQFSREEQDVLDEYDADAGGEQESDFTMLMGDVIDIIDRLYKISTKIRTSSTRLRSSKIFQYHDVDPDSQVDLIDQYRKVDESHIWELFRSYQSNATPDAENFLLYRISLANTRRRQQFGYWRRHHEKMKSAAIREKNNKANSYQNIAPRVERARSVIEDSPHLHDPTIVKNLTSVPSLTTATHLTSSQVRMDDEISTISVSTYSASNLGTEEVNDFPDPPRSFIGLKHFECPYCFTLCSRAYTAKKAWRAHLLHDLRPYVCTYERCAIGEHLYFSRRQWIDHENAVHRRRWTCLKHPGLIFASITLYQDHVNSHHAEELNEMLSDQLIKASESTPATPERPCPFCLATLATNDSMERHVSRHLERIASFSLPRSTGLEDDLLESESLQGSADAQMQDFQSDLSGLLAFTDESSSDLDGSNGRDEKTILNPLTSDSLQRSRITSEEPASSKISTFLGELSSAEAPDSVISETDATRFQEEQSQKPLRPVENLEDNLEPHSPPSGRPTPVGVDNPATHTQEGDKREDTHNQSAKLLNVDGSPSMDLSVLISAIAHCLMTMVRPLNYHLITPEKMQSLYVLFRVPGERYDWFRVFDDSKASISRLYRHLQLEHHLTSHGRSFKERPDLPCLTPAGFKNWMVLMLRIDPETEILRLKKILTVSKWQKNIASWPKRAEVPDFYTPTVQSDLDLIPTDRWNHPSFFHLEDIHSEPDAVLREDVKKAIAEHCGVEELTHPRPLDEAIPGINPWDLEIDSPLNQSAATADVEPKLQSDAIDPELVRLITEQVIKNIKEQHPDNLA